MTPSRLSPTELVGLEASALLSPWGLPLLFSSCLSVFFTAHIYETLPMCQTQS